MLEAGLRTESPVSDPIAKEMAFVKVAAAPEEEPPTKYSLFFGWKILPYAECSPLPPSPNSSRFVRPTQVAPL